MKNNRKTGLIAAAAAVIVVIVAAVLFFLLTQPVTNENTQGIHGVVAGRRL